MATSNIQYSGLENGIFFIEEQEGYDEHYEDLKANIKAEEYIEEVKVYDRDYEEWTILSLMIIIKGCYYTGMNLIIIADQELSDLDLSKTSQLKIDIAIRKLEKIMAQHSTQIKVKARFSNGETMYEKV